MGSTTRWRILQAGAEGVCSASASIDLLTDQTSRESVQLLALKHLLAIATKDSRTVFVTLPEGISVSFGAGSCSLVLNHAARLPRLSGRTSSMYRVQLASDGWNKECVCKEHSVGYSIFNNEARVSLLFLRYLDVLGT